MAEKSDAATDGVEVHAQVADGGGAEGTTEAGVRALRWLASLFSTCSEERDLQLWSGQAGEGQEWGNSVSSRYGLGR